MPDEMTFLKLVDAVIQVHREMAAEAGRAVNLVLTLRNWLTGAYIVEYEQRGEGRAAYGAEILPRLARELRQLQVAACEERRLRAYRQFYLAYPGFRTLLAPHVGNSETMRETLPEIWRSPTAETHITLDSIVLQIRRSLTAESGQAVPDSGEKVRMTGLPGKWASGSIVQSGAICPNGAAACSPGLPRRATLGSRCQPIFQPHQGCGMDPSVQETIRLRIPHGHGCRRGGMTQPRRGWHAGRTYDSRVASGTPQPFDPIRSPVGALGRGMMPTDSAPTGLRNAAKGCPIGLPWDGHAKPSHQPQRGCGMRTLGMGGIGHG